MFPSFLNAEKTVDPQPGLSFGYITDILVYEIDMMMFFMPLQGKYSVRERRPWVSVVIKAFNANSLMSATVQESHLGKANFNPIEFNGEKYVGITFPITVWVNE